MRLTHPVLQNLKQQSSDGGPTLRRKTQLHMNPPPPPQPRRPLPLQRGGLPAAWVAGGGPGRAARLGAGRLGARVRVVGGQHHAARVLYFHRQPRMSPLRPENKGGDQHGPAHRTGHRRGGAARPAPRAEGLLPPLGCQGRGQAAPPAGRRLARIQIHAHQAPWGGVGRGGRGGASGCRRPRTG